MKIQGSTALVTGASRRIGRALALALAAQGCNVAVHYNTSVDGALETRDMARGFGVKGEAIQADLSDTDQCARLWSETIDKLGEIPNIVINNASFFNRVGIADVTPNDFDHAMAVNVRAPLLLSQAMARDLPDDAIGKIVNINDRRTVYRSRVAYSITNSALTGLTKTLALSLAPRIQVNELRLGAILPMTDDQSAGSRSYSNSTLGPAGRMGTLNVRAPLLLAQAMARDLPDDAIGKIVNINDRRTAYRTRIAYSITNSALTGLTKTLAVSLAPRIQVNELRLGAILPMTDDQSAESRSYSNSTLGPAGRMGTVEEVSQAVISIIGNDYINGASLNIDGGLSAIDGS